MPALTQLSEEEQMFRTSVRKFAREQLAPRSREMDERSAFEKGLLATTLRYGYEVREPAAYFEDIPDEQIPKDMLDLASHIVEMKAGHFDPSKFDDRYEDALKDLLKRKQEGRPIERPARREPTNVVNLMDALRRSLEESGARTSGKEKSRAAPARSGAAEKSEQPKRKRTKSG